MNMEQVFALLSVLMPIAAGLAATGVHLILSKVPEKDQLVLKEIASFVVPAVEQAASMLSGEGKRQQAIKVIGDIAASMGVPVNPLIVESAIEAAVYAMNVARQQQVTVVRPAPVFPAK